MLYIDIAFVCVITEVHIYAIVLFKLYQKNAMKESLHLKCYVSKYLLRIISVKSESTLTSTLRYSVVL